MEKTRKQLHRLTAGIMACLLLFLLTAVSAEAAESSKGLVVEKLTFRDVLRQYAMDPEHFGTDAGTADESGITAGARSLASFFAYTVGLNYSGEGMNYNYYGKDITAGMDEEPYIEENLLATYEAEIKPYHGYANPLTKGQTLAIRVYRVGYQNAANGVEPVLHYVWEENGSFFAVKDDNPFYKVSWNGMNAVDAAAQGAYVCRSRSVGAGTEAPGTWSSLTGLAPTECVHLTDGTLVVGDGNANIFAVTSDLTALQNDRGYSSHITEISDYVCGGTTYQTGALLYSSDIYRADTMELLDSSTALENGTAYLVRLVYEEGLVQGKGTAGVTASCGTTELSGGISDFVWYGSEEHLTANDYDPRTIEFTFVPKGGDGHFCRFHVNALTGESSALAPAPTFARMNTAEVKYTPAATAAPTSAAATAVTSLATVQTDTGTALTRGDAALMLWERSGSPEVGQYTRFSDLPADNKQATAISWVAQKGLIVGYGDNTFGPGNTFTREQCTVILSRFAAIQGSRAVVVGTLDAYTDGASVSSWARDSVVWAVKEGLLTAQNGKLCPKDAATRTGFAAMLDTLEANR